MASKPQLQVGESAVESAQNCANYVQGILEEAVNRVDFATLAISGGSTPKPMFQALAGSRLDWRQIHVFWVDERCVSPASDQSNYKLARETLLEKAAIPESNIHRIYGELPPDEGAQKYARDIRQFFGTKDDESPAFDVVHRGIGPDAHTASLFPGEPLIGHKGGIAAPVWVEKLKSHRVTLLPDVLRAARHTVIQAAGADKAEPIYNVLFGPEDPFAYPCQIAARDSDRAIWFLDPAAAARVRP